MSARALLAPLAIPLVLALAPSPARADRYARGITLFQQRRCGSCHTVGWKDPVRARDDRGRYKDLTRVVDEKDDGALARWLRDPYAVRAATGCHHTRLTDEEIGELIAFFHARAVTAAKRDEPPPTGAAGASPGGTVRATTVVESAKVDLAPARSPQQKRSR